MNRVTAISAAVVIVTAAAVLESRCANAATAVSARGKSREGSPPGTADSEAGRTRPVSLRGGKKRHSPTSFATKRSGTRKEGILVTAEATAVQDGEVEIRNPVAEHERKHAMYMAVASCLGSKAMEDLFFGLSRCLEGKGPALRLELRRVFQFLQARVKQWLMLKKSMVPRWAATHVTVPWGGRSHQVSFAALEEYLRKNRVGIRSIGRQLHMLHSGSPNFYSDAVKLLGSAALASFTTWRTKEHAKLFLTHRFTTEGIRAVEQGVMLKLCWKYDALLQLQERYVGMQGDVSTAGSRPEWADPEGDVSTEEWQKGAELLEKMAVELEAELKARNGNVETLRADPCWVDIQALLDAKAMLATAAVLTGAHLEVAVEDCASKDVPAGPSRTSHRLSRASRASTKASSLR